MDMAFLLAESRETPMHVGTLALFRLPDGADEQEFLAEQLAILRSPTEWRRPFGHRLEKRRLGTDYHWVPDDRLDVDYHVRHSALPKPGRYRELFVLASRLHQTLLDRHRPLWEAHLIEGLQGRQFAAYAKVHHAGIDGAGGMRVASSMLTPDPDARIGYSPFSMEAHEVAMAARPERPPEPPGERELRAVAEVLRQSFGVSKNVFDRLRIYARSRIQREAEGLTTAWASSPVTSFSSKVTGARRFVAQSYSLPRMKAVAKALGGTLNDVLLAVCGGALRKYLLSLGELPDAPLTAMTPVALRAKSEDGAGNALGALTANLATHLDDPAARFELTKASMDQGKSLLHDMSPREIELFTQLTQAPALLVAALGLGDRFPPYSTVISNVPGPREVSYWNGARLDGMYPVSAVYHGFAMNITVMSNADQLDFGVTACRESVPSCQRIIDHLEDALVELEGVAGL